jgi:hypothetical protein
MLYVSFGNVKVLTSAATFLLCNNVMVLEIAAARAECKVATCPVGGNDPMTTSAG